MVYNFPRSLRLTTDYQFKYVFRKAKRTSTNVCAFLFCYNKLNHPRLGVIVSKKNIKEAHDRNCFKRVTRESFRLKQHDLEAIDIVVLAYAGAKNLSKQELCQHLEKQWNLLIQHSKKP